MHNAVVMFSVKDKDLFGYANQYIAECYLIFQNIPEDSSDQIHLKLSRPTCTCKLDCQLRSIANNFCTFCFVLFQRRNVSMHWNIDRAINRPKILLKS